MASQQVAACISPVAGLYTTPSAGSPSTTSATEMAYSAMPLQVFPSAVDRVHHPHAVAAEPLGSVAVLFAQPAVPREIAM